MSIDPYSAALQQWSGVPPLQIVRHPRRRRVGLYRTDGALQIRIPARLSVRRWQDWLVEHHDWLRHNAATLLRQVPAVQAMPLVEGALLPIEGQLRPLRWRTAQHAYVTTKILPLQIDVCGAVLHGAARERIRASVHAAYRRHALVRWTPRIHAAAAQLGVTVQRIRITDPATRWGSCSARGTIALNWRLLAAPRWVADYVIWHEVCHLRHMNHSAKFWALLATYTPHVAAARAWLRCCGETLRQVVD